MTSLEKKIQMKDRMQLPNVEIPDTLIICKYISVSRKESRSSGIFMLCHVYSVKTAVSVC